MELDNRTSFPALIFRGIIDEHYLCASVLARVTYSVVGGALQVAGEQTWKVSAPPWECEYGPMDSDEVFYKGGTDVFVLGAARAPGNRPVVRQDVSVKVGDSFERTVTVWGDRVWNRGSNGLVPSKPRPFTEMPLTLERAFGGKDEWDELQVPFPDNPVGRGFYLDEASAVGRPLPNIEDPAAPVRSWDDRPEPVGVGMCGMGFGPKLRRAVRFSDSLGVLSELKPIFFNAAFPDMIALRARPGDVVRVTGVRADGPIEFAIPPTPMAVRVRFGDERDEQAPRLDQIGIEVDKQQVFIAYRYPFRYRLVPLQLRSCELIPAGGA